MSRLVDADKLKNKKYKDTRDYDVYFEQFKLGWNAAIDMIINHEPTAEEPADEWKYIIPDLNTIGSFVCPKCNEPCATLPYNQKYCHNCGMRLKLPRIGK